MTANGTPAGEAKPLISVLAQYVKDLSFENPNAPRSLVSQGQTPNIEISVDVSARGLSETDVEVELKISGKASSEQNVVFGFELVYGGVFRLGDIEEKDRPPLVLIECPRLLFPFARQIIAEAVRNGGFPPLMIDPIDFVALYRKRFLEQQDAVASA